MTNQSYGEKLNQLTQIFDGDADYARAVLEKWLQKNRAALEEKILAEVAQRLAGLSSMVPLNFKITIDAQGVRLPGETPPAKAEKPGKRQRSAPKTKGKNPLFEP